VAATGEIPLDDINRKHTVIVPKYTSELCHAMIKFAWSRTSEDIIIKPETEDRILEWARKLGTKYSAVIPLIEPADAKNKVARLAVALAIRLFNVDDNNKVIVEPYHVDYICNWLNQMYCKPKFQYDKFSEKEIRRNNLLHKEEVITALRLKPDVNGDLDWSWYDVKGQIDDMLDYALIDIQQLAMIMGTQSYANDFGKKFLRLKRSNAISMADARRVKLNPCLINFLREMQSEVNARLEDPEVEQF